VRPRDDIPLHPFFRLRPEPPAITRRRASSLATPEVATAPIYARDTDISPEAVRETREAGYRAAFQDYGGGAVSGSNPFRPPRIELGGGPRHHGMEGPGGGAEPPVHHRPQDRPDRQSDPMPPLESPSQLTDDQRMVPTYRPVQGAQGGAAGPAVGGQESIKGVAGPVQRQALPDQSHERDVIDDESGV